MSGKGDASRPLSVPRAVFDSNHARIFGERQRTPYVPPPLPAPEPEAHDDADPRD